MSARRLKIVVSLHTKASLYHEREALAAQKSSLQHGFDVSIIYADGDALIQSKQLLDIIQSPPSNRPDVIILDPVGTGMALVAQEAVKSGIGWIVLNREVDYVTELRRNAKVPVFAVTTNHLETGRIQARQVHALLPQGGMVLYLLGATGSPVATLRSQGMQELKAPNIRLKTLNGHWLEEAAFDAMNKWLQLSAIRDTRLSVVVAQNDLMAMGARKAFLLWARDQGHPQKAAVQFLGCDGMEVYGLDWVHKGLLRATVLCPPLTARAMDLLAGKIPQASNSPTVIFTEPLSFPAIGELAVH